MWSVVHLPLALSEHGQLDEVVAVPRRERLEQLQPVAVGSTTTSTRRAVGGRGEEALLARLEPADGKLLADGRLEAARRRSSSVSGLKSSVPASA